MKTSRHVALELLLKTLQQKEAFSSDFKNISSIKPQDVAFIKAICFGVLRFYFRLEFILKELLNKKLSDKDIDIYTLLMIGIFQIEELKMPSYAVIDETVEITKKIKKPWATALVNAVLRNFLRQQKSIMQKVIQNEVAFYAHPKWYIEKIRTEYSLEWKQILEANNQTPPLSVRVNLSKTSQEEFCNYLKTQNLDYQMIQGSHTGIRFMSSLALEKSEPFHAGLFSVQDVGAQFVPQVLKVEPQHILLDACAAPGGKTCHLLEFTQNQAKVIAADIDGHRLKKVKENLSRLELKASLLESDAALLNQHFKNSHFDRILLDVPCSGSGVIRRHPDIKLLRKKSDIAYFAEKQIALLQSTWPLLKKKGYLLYVTCSLFSDENEQLMAQFLKIEPSATESKFTLPMGIEKKLGWQILPNTDSDGFYYCLLLKN